MAKRNLAKTEAGLGLKDKEKLSFLCWKEKLPYYKITILNLLKKR